MARNIIYLVNPISGTKGKTSLKELIARRTQEKGIAYEIMPTNAEGDYAFLLAILHQQPVTDIVVCGGDGTVSAVMAALQGASTRVGVIPMGSGNGLAFAAGIPRDPEKALDIIFAGKASAIDGFLINGHYSCMLCGIGFDAAVAHEFARQPKRGLQTYARVTLSNYFRSRAYPFEVALPGAVTASFRTDAFFIDVANGNQFGNNFTIAPKASLSDGLLDIVIVKKTSRFSFLLSTVRQVLGGYGIQSDAAKPTKRNVLYFRCAELVIKNPAAAPLHIDGDPAATAEEFRISIVPSAIQLIQP